ncbi:MAG: TQO small subunit DoxD [Nitrososphaerota archaeon]
MKQSTTSRQQRRQQVQRPAAHRETAPTSTRTQPHAGAWKPATLAPLMLAPLRLFLGITFAYAGIQKLTDPQFFAPNTTGYIGRQITAFAAGSPLRAPLLQVALPHAMLFGSLVAWGELAIGIATLLGLLLRPAALFGALLSFLFFLSASWRVHPYFYGSDIVFLFAWLTLLLVGPVAGGWFALDTRLVAWLAERVPLEYADRFEGAVGMLLGVRPAVTEAQSGRGRVPARGGRGSRYATSTRRDFLRGAFTGIATTVGAALAITLFTKGGTSATPAPAPTATTATGDAATTTTPASGGAAIASTSQVPVNSAASFTLPANGDPGVLVHLTDGNFVAFDATCTHAGCPVQYDPSSKLLLCPCHGAAFDPAHNAEVIQGPADTPLASVPIQVDSATGAITVSN